MNRGQVVGFNTEAGSVFSSISTAFEQTWYLSTPGKHNGSPESLWKFHVPDARHVHAQISSILNTKLAKAKATFESGEKPSARLDNGLSRQRFFLPSYEHECCIINSTPTPFQLLFFVCLYNGELKNKLKIVKSLLKWVTFLSFFLCSFLQCWLQLESVFSWRQLHQLFCSGVFKTF